MNRIKLCECGCGKIVKPKRRFVLNHHKKGSHKEMGCLCASCLSKMGKLKGENHPLYGKHHSEETKNKISKKNKGKNSGPIQYERGPRSEESKIKTSNTLKITMSNPEVKEKMRNSQLGRKHNEETKKKIKEATFETWKNMGPEEKSQRIKKSLVFQSPNKKEIFLSLLLEKLFPGQYRFVGNGELIIAGKCPDFININGQKKIIELFGDFWHQGENPANRIEIFKPFGYETLVIWEKELKNKKEVESKLIHFHEVKHGNQ